MDPQIKTQVDAAKQQMEKAILHLEQELTKIRAGKANPSMLDNIMVDAYGAKTPINQVGNINTQDSRTLVIQPWDKSMLDGIAKAIHESNLGLNPQNDGTLIRLSIPPLTEERRKDLVKKAKVEAENCKVAIRTIRKDANEAVKRSQKDGVPEDEVKDGEKQIQLLTDSYSTKCDKHLEIKEKEIMTV